MGRTQVYNLPPGMASNPYQGMKAQIPIKTTCELCNRTINTRDWPMHKNSKAHRGLEQAGKDKENAKINTIAGGTDTFGFAPEDGFSLGPVDSNGNDWAASTKSGGTFGSSGFGNRNGGGDRVCFGCGETGHEKRDCPHAGGSTDRACFSCGEVGHNKRECPNGGGTGGACYSCGEAGHSKKDCPSGGGSSDRACFGCGEVGHTKRDCPAASGGGQACFNCGMEGHRKIDCPEPLKPRGGGGGGGGGGRACFNCLQPGHNAVDCPEPPIERCRNCDAVGHVSRGCPERKDWSRVKCRKCFQYGHGEKKCPEPASGSGDNSVSGDKDTDSEGASGWPSERDDGGAANPDNWINPAVIEVEW